MAMKIDLNYPVLGESNIRGLTLLERGKVRDIYDMGNALPLLATDRISTHDVVYEDCIPHKGYGLTATPVFVFMKTSDIIPNHFISNPDPNVTIVKKAKPYPVEFVVRRILTGSGWRDYELYGSVSGIKLPKGLKKNQMLDYPIITPSTKAERGKHDENITDAKARSLVGPIWEEMKRVGLKLYERGMQLAAMNGAIIADTKFEFGSNEEYDLLLVDEIFTHDSSRILEKEKWEQIFREGGNPHWIDKQFVRDYAESLGFRGNGPAPRLPDSIKLGAAERVFRVYELMTGTELPLPEEPPTNERIERNLRKAGLL